MTNTFYLNLFYDTRANFYLIIKEYNAGYKSKFGVHSFQWDLT